MRLDERVALVTGTGPNIGREIAQTLARAGATVVCNDVDAEAAADCARSIEGAGGQAIPSAGDVGDEAQVATIVQRGIDAYGYVDVLVNNAAITHPKGVLETETADWERVIRVNLTGSFLMSREVARRLVDQGRGGAIVNIASTSGHRGRADALAYCSAKGGVLNMTRAMAMDLVTHGIRVNSVTPTKTGISVGSLESSTERFYAEIPMERLGEPEDQANAVLFLASDASAFCTGVDIRVDGGSLATWGLQPKAMEQFRRAAGA
ncbi:MAG: glucose 1-dehydrogenase [Actinobacteria bacterium]|nr:glucose 1-dehydrogenase [Actinomycetota bacterium]